MQVTENTKYSVFAPVEQYATPETIENLKQAAQKIYGDTWSLTIGQFAELSDGNGFYDILGDTSDPTVLQVYWLKAFADFAKDFAKVLESVKIPQDAAELQAAESCKKVSMLEGMLVFARGYFGLHSFADAEQVTLADYVIARRDEYNKAIYSRKLADLRTKQYRKK